MLPLEGSLRGLREAAFLRVDHSPAPTPEQVAFANNFVNQAIQQFVLEHPYACHEEAVRIATDYPFASFDDTDTVTVVEHADEGSNVPLGLFDAMTLKRDLPLASLTAAQVWPYDRSLDGAFIEIIDENNVSHFNQIKSIWIDLNGSAPPQVQYISLVRPFNVFRRDTLNVIVTPGPFKYRIFHPYVWFPDDVIDYRSIRLLGNNFKFPLDIIEQDEAEDAGIVDFASDEAHGVPRLAYRRGHFQLQGPNVAPVCSAISGTLAHKWLGTEPYGAFQYCYTYTWGKRDYDLENGGRGFYGDSFLNFQEYEDSYVYADNSGSDAFNQAVYWTDNRKREPLFESAPSPASATFTIADPGGASQVNAIQIQFPNIQYMLGHLFTGRRNNGAAADMRRLADTHSGVHIRIYRRRISTQIGAGYAALGDALTGQRVETLHMLDVSDAFHLLAEFRVDASNESRFIDDGSILPDYNRRLRNVHGYQGVRLHPVPDARYEIEARVVRRPPLLVSDQDVPKVHPEACQAIVDLTTAYMYERFQNFGASQRAMQLYAQNSTIFAQRYGSMKPESAVSRRRPARSTGYGGPGTRWWNRYRG